jgi:ABC-type dipeptide/oligopeptide/nickel transport system ATPase subunit
MALKLYDKLKHTVRYWLLRNLPPCQQTVEMISQSMERSLTPSERVKTRLHVWICVWCQWYLEQLQLIRDASRAQAEKAPEVMTDATLSNDARERIRRRLTNQE